MIHIKETEIIPLLKEAQTEYSQKINEGDPKDVEMAERNWGGADEAGNNNGVFVLWKRWL